MIAQAVFGASQNIWLSVQTVKFWLADAFLSKGERTFHARTEVTLLLSRTAITSDY